MSIVSATGLILFVQVLPARDEQLGFLVKGDSRLAPSLCRSEVSANSWIGIMLYCIVAGSAVPERTTYQRPPYLHEAALKPRPILSAEIHVHDAAEPWGG